MQPDREDVLVRAASPVARSAYERPERDPEEGIGLCLSGGGYRAMLFHIGALRRLNELGYLPRLKRISSVSGGSITAGALAVKWSQLGFDGSGVGQRFVPEVEEPIRRLAGKTIDVSSTFFGVVGPGSVGKRIAGAYRSRLFGDADLSNLPPEPRFVFNATNLQSGALWRFSRPYMRDYRVGEVPNPTVDLATVVAASSAFPPVLSPVTLELRDDQYAPAVDEDLHRSPFTTRVVLSDGGVYDNLGLETVWKRYKTVLVSDGGGKMEPEEKPSALWPLQSYRILSVIDNQVRNLRKRQVIDSYKAGIREGVYWGIRTNVADYGVETKLECPVERTLELAAIKTRLQKLDRVTQERLVNWGYAVCDAGIRAHVDPAITAADHFPYPASGVG